MATAGLLKPRKKITYGKPVLPKINKGGTSLGGAVSPTQPKAPAPFTPAAAPAAKVTPPPAPTLASQSDRIGAREGYGGTVADVNSQMRNLASNYGFAPSVVQFGWDPNAAWDPVSQTFGGADTQSELDVTKSQPGSTADVLLRNLQGSQRSIDETANSQNTFFSSRRLEDRGRADTDYGAQIAQAKRDYDEAVRTLTNSITQGRSGRNQTFRNADIADIQNVTATPPENQAADVIPPRPQFAQGVSLGTGMKQVFDPTLKRWVIKDKTGKVMWG